jgi:hypothetical protein
MVDFKAWREKERDHLSYRNLTDLERGQAQGSIHFLDFCIQAKP